MWFLFIGDHQIIVELKPFFKMFYSTQSLVYQKEPHYMYDLDDDLDEDGFVSLPASQFGYGSSTSSDSDAENQKIRCNYGGAGLTTLIKTRKGEWS